MGTTLWVVAWLLAGPVEPGCMDEAEAAIRAKHQKAHGAKKQAELAKALARENCRAAAFAVWDQVAGGMPWESRRGVVIDQGLTIVGWCREAWCSRATCDRGLDALKQWAASEEASRARAQGNVDALKQACRKWHPPQKPVVAAPATEKPVQQAEVKAPVAPPAALATTVVESVQPPAEDPLLPPWLLYSLAGAGLIGGGVATVAYVQWEDAKEPQENEDWREDGRKVNLAFMVLGYGAAVGFATWGLLEQLDESDRNATTRVLFSPRGLGLTGTW